MPIELNETLVVGISATALFDLSEADRVFQEKYESDPDTAIDEYRSYMLEREDEALEDGTAGDVPSAKVLYPSNSPLRELTAKK